MHDAIIIVCFNALLDGKRCGVKGFKFFIEKIRIILVQKLQIAACLKLIFEHYALELEEDFQTSG